MSHPFSWHDLLRYGHLWGYLLKWPVYFVAGWVAIYFRKWRKDRNESIAQGWPSVEGVVIGGKVTPIPKTSHFHVTLQYTTSSVSTAPASTPMTSLAKPKQTSSSVR